MSSVSCVSTTSEHLKVLVGNAAEYLAVPANVDRILAAHVQGGPAVTILRADGSPLAAMGGCHLWKGVVDTWAMIASGEKGFSDIRRIQVAARTLVLDAFKYHGIHRLQADVRADWDRGCRWMHVLGFTPEGPLHSYGTGGEDYIRYAIWR